jgi:hypothetical protein
MLCQRCSGTGRILGFGTITAMRVWLPCRECVGTGFVDVWEWMP